MILMGVAIWSHCTELAAHFEDDALRILVIVSDRGPELWALVQALALFFLLRVFYQPDPLHCMAGVMGSTISCDKVVYKAAMGVVTVSKYVRAPFGSFRNWCAVISSIEWFLKEYSLNDSSVASDFVAGIAQDLGLSAEQLVGNVRELRRILTEFTKESCGPRVEMRRWFTWTPHP
jgi:hypothetical protein